MSQPAGRAIERPDIIIPDAGPLTHLSQADALPLLHDIGGAAIIVDMPRFKLAADLSKPEALRLQAWIGQGLQLGSNQAVRLETTGTGKALSLARLVRPDFKMRNGGETAIVQWLGENYCWPQPRDAGAV